MVPHFPKQCVQILAWDRTLCGAKAYGFTHPVDILASANAVLSDVMLDQVDTET